MDVKLLCLTVVLLSSPLLTLCDPLYVLSAPNLLRVGSSEKVFVEAQDYTGEELKVRITVKDFPAKHQEILSKSVTLTADKSFQLLADIKIPDDQKLFSDDPLEKQYVYLQAKFPSTTLEKVVMVSFQSGYIFIQTDKPIYTPGAKVNYRIFSVTPSMTPSPNNTGITVEIMNPQSITVSSEKILPAKGMKSGKFIIPEMASSGIWKVVTRFSNIVQKKFTVDFEVKEYVLPTFEVKLKPSKSFFNVSDESLEVNIEAKYLFGKKVIGNAFAVFGVMVGEKKMSIPSSLKKVQIIKGEGTAELTNEMIKNTFPDINQLVGQSIYVSVSVLTESGSEMVEAEKRGIQIVTSPYTIHFKKTPHFFKPGMPFDVSVYVTNPDQTPAENVEVEISPGGHSKTKANGIAKFSINTAQQGSSFLEITAKTKDSELTVKKMIAWAYKPKDDSNNYLHIGIDAAELKIGDQIKVFLNTRQSQEVKYKDYTYMILSKGQIVEVNRFKQTGQSLVSLSVSVTEHMVPSFRFVAYYHVGLSEVVSDSVWVDVKDTCMGTLKLEVKDRKKNTYEAGEEVELQITGDPGAKVGHVVVDKAVHILNKNRLTQAKIWDVIEQHDIGCTAGGGKDSMGVFSDAGLMFQSSTAGGTETRTVSHCTIPAKRKRRADSLLHITTTLAGKYSGELKQCCTDGMRTRKLGYTCERRATFIVDGPECVKAFLHCCNEMKNSMSFETEEEELILARTDEEEPYYTDSEDIVSRTQFPESWFWEEIELCEKCKDIKKIMYLKDSITTWQILAVSLSPTLGICVAEPEEVVVFKSFFIDLKIPYSAVRGEQVEIKAIIHNYTPRDLKKVRVEFKETEDICSSAWKKGKYRTIIQKIDKGSSVAVSYVIIPMALGHHYIEVKASIFEFEDGVRKTLKVVSEGVLTHLPPQNLDIRPVKDDAKPIHLKARIPDDRVPGTPANTYLRITGEEIAQTVEKSISGDFMGRLIFLQPFGCGEQNMYRMTLPLIATHYLDHTNQWDAVGVERRSKAIELIGTGYQWQLTYRNKHGAYSIWKYTPGSTWLTAYVAKVFAMAHNLITIEDNVICSALEWLVLQKQQPDGSFREDAPVHSNHMVGGIKGNNADASLTAFVVIAMQESRKFCANSVFSLPESIRKAVSFLEGRLPQLTNPYAVAMTSYAMANENKLRKDILLRHSTQREDGLSWTVPGERYHSLEATAYAVLALVKAKNFDEAGEAVHWMAKQQTHYGGYGTTQATIMVFQAVAEYRTQVKDRQNFNLEVELSMSGRAKPVTWTFRKDNKHITRSDRMPVDANLTVTARGTGTATLSVTTMYYARPVEKESDCTAFDLTVTMEESSETKAGAIASYSFTMEFIYKKDTANASMTILDIGLPTGFDIEEKDLKELSTGKDRNIQKYEKNKVVSERGSLILYLNKVSNAETETVVFQMHKMLNVGLLQPAAVTIYEYYSPDARCTKFYHPERTDGAIYRLCKGEACQCAEGNCTYQLKNNVDENLRLNTSCDSSIDYVYKVKMVEMNLTQETDTYAMKVEQVLKEGTDVVIEGDVRLFVARPGCRDHLGLVKDKSYLIMGGYVDIANSKQYVFGEDTWVEYWPTREESQTAKHRDRYIGIAELQNSLQNGCAT